MKKYLNYMIVIVLVFFAAYYFFRNKADLQGLLDVRPMYIIIMLAAGIAQFFVSGSFTKIILKPFGIGIKIKELFALAIFTCLGNYLLPLRGGLGLRAVYLKKRYNFSYPYFLSSLAGIYLVYFLTNSLLGLGALFFLYYYWGITSMTLGLTFATVSLGVFTPLILNTKRLSHNRETHLSGNALAPSMAFFNDMLGPWSLLGDKLTNFFYQIIEGWNYLQKKPLLIFQLILLTLLNSLVNMTLLYCGFLSSSARPTILGLVMISSILSISGLLNITPAAMGIQEAAIIFSSNILNITTIQSLTASILMRLVILTTAFILAPFLGHYLIRKIGNSSGSLSFRAQREIFPRPEVNKDSSLWSK